jgi:small-conductance mechanosensitive channel
MNNKNPFRLDELPPEHPLRQQPFTVPDGYFDQLPTRVQARMMRRSKPAFSISWSWQRTAASLAGASLIAVLFWQTLPQRQESLGSEALTGVSPEVISAYLDDQGVYADELADSQQLHQSLGSDTTAIQYLNVKPADIQTLIDEQSALETQQAGS